jgi:Ca2+-transporting ATPase
MVPSNPMLSTPKGGTPQAFSLASSIISADEQEDALQPDPGTEADFKVDNNPFHYSPGQLNKLLNPKSLPALRALGGLPGLVNGLRTDPKAGLSANETSVGTHGSDSKEAFADRIRVFKRNVLPEKKATPLWKLMWMAYNDKVLILLTAAAVISLALGLYETFGVEHPPGSGMPLDWVEGCAICVAIIIVVMVGSLNDYQKERAFVRLNAKKEDREVTVVRSGKAVRISVHDVLVGDILCLEPGDLVPVDGIFIEGHNVKCDESSATGESDQLKKTGAEQVMRLLEQGHTKRQDLDPFIISGSKVLEGVGTCLVTSVGVNSSYGKILMAMRQDMDPTPLQKKLDGLAGAIAKLGGSAAVLLFFVLLFRFLGTLPGSHQTSTEKASKFTDILIVAITVIVVAVPEGLPLAVTLALAFATTRMVKLNNLVRVLKSCETMGNATTVCSDKTGTLTQNRMTVVTGTFGSDEFDDKSQATDARRSAAFANDMAPGHKRMIIESIAINSTAFEGEDNGVPGFIGSKTETALLGFARDVLGMTSLAEERANATVIQLMPFDSGRKCMGAVVKLSDGTHRFLVKGASEILLRYSSLLWMPSGQVTLGSEERERLEGVILNYAKQSLRTIALVYRDFAEWPPRHAVNPEDPSEADLGLLLSDMTFLGVVGIQDPIRPGVPEAVAKCHHAGVMVRMVTGDNMVTAKAIATDCGIYTGGIVMEGPKFRTLSDEEFKEILPQLQVLARSSPEDKRILVTKLRDMGEIVAVTGDGTNDGPALKAANIGFSMGIAGTEVAKEASAIVLMDDNFSSILTALMWGRAVNDAVRKFLQFQITVNITAVLLTFISSVSDPEMRSVLTAVQLLWINLIM